MRGAAALVGTLVLLAGCGDEGSTEVTPDAVKRALEARLVDRNLSFEWVYCLRTKRSFEGHPVIRCNVNFGEPHIVIYCATFEDGRLVTNREQRELRCGRAP